MYKTATKTSTSDDNTCLVCGEKTNNTHFQVNCCRACAMFFRRSVKAKKVYKCRRGNRNCEISKKDKEAPMCRFCRLQKCYTVGMRYDKNNDSSSEEGTSRLVPISSDEKNIVYLPPARSNLPIPPCNAQDSHVPLINGAIKLQDRISDIVQNVKNTLNQPFPPTHLNLPRGVHMTPFQQLQLGFSQFLEVVQPDIEDVEIVDVADKSEMSKFQEGYVERMAEMVMCCEAFANLPSEDKWLLFRHCWFPFFSLERNYTTFEMFGYDTDRYLLGMRFVTHPETKWFVGNLTPQQSDEFVHPLKYKWHEDIGDPMRKLQMTQFELVFILMNMMFNVYEVKGISKPTKELGYKLLEQASSELHNYYFYDKQITNYAPRLTQLMKMISVAECYVHQAKDYMMMAKVFNIFDNALTVSELVE